MNDKSWCNLFERELALLVTLQGVISWKGDSIQHLGKSCLWPGHQKTAEGAEASLWIAIPGAWQLANLDVPSLAKARKNTRSYNTKTWLTVHSLEVPRLLYQYPWIQNYSQSLYHNSIVMILNQIKNSYSNIKSSRSWTKAQSLVLLQ